MGRKNHKLTTEVTALRSEKTYLVPAMVPDDWHLRREHERDTNAALRQSDLMDDYYDSRERADSYSEFVHEHGSQEIVQLYHKAVGYAVSFPEGEETDDRIDQFNSDILKLIDIISDDPPSELRSIPRSDVLPARFGCWCSENSGKEDDDSHSLELAAASKFLNPWLYEQYLEENSNKGDSAVNPYLLSSYEWHEQQRQTKIQHLKAKWSRGKRLAKDEVKASPSAATQRVPTPSKIKAVRPPAAVPTSDRFQALKTRK